MTTQEKLIAIYEQAEKRLFAIIQRKGAFASSSMYERTLLRQIQEELKRLKVQSAKTVSELVTENYQASLDSLVQDLQAMGVPIDVDTTPAQLAMSRLNTRQIEMIARNVSTDFNGAIDAIGRRTQDVIRNVTLEATAQKLSTGQTIQQMQKSLTEIFKAQNIMSVQYANGVNMPIKKYAEMTARSTTAEAQNKAQTTQGKEWGYDLVKMTTHSPTCPTCAMYQGRVYALTKEAANGKYKTRDGTVLHFPYLYETAFVRGYDTIHPNCRHRISIFPPQAYTSDELKAYSAKSTAPFEDTRSDRERKKYAEQQAEKRRRNEERKQYERIRAALPDTAPKSYAGFVRMKYTNSQKYQELMEDYRYVTRVAKAQNDGIIDTEADKKAKHIYSLLSKEERLEVIHKGQNADKPVFSYDRDDNKAMSNLQKTAKEKNTFDVIAHGSASSMEFFRQDYPEKDKRRNIDAYTLSCILKGRKDYQNFLSDCNRKNEEPSIRLLSCNTGNTTETGNCFAQLLANEMGVNVKAPTDTLYANPDGTFYVGAKKNGQIKIFYPRK